MPALNPATDTAKCYPSSPQQFGPPAAGHRTTQRVGHDFQATTDDDKTDPKAGSTYTWMRKHPA